MRKILPINLQLFADGGDGNGDQNAGGDNGQAGQQGGQNNQQTAGVDYDKIQAMLDNATAKKENAVLKSYFQQQGLSEDEISQAIATFKQNKQQQTEQQQNANANLQNEVAAAQKVAEQAQIELAATKVAMTLQFMVDKADVDETNQTASMQNISHIFEQTQVVPETDALFFSKVAQAAQNTELYHSETSATEYTTENVFAKLKAILAAGKLRRYKANGSLIMYVSSDIMDKLEMSKEFTRKIEMTQIAEGGLGIETRVTDIDGVTLMEVVDDERFYDRFDWDVKEGGFAPLKSKYAATTDTDVAEGKTYYTKSDSTYTVVAKPTKTNIATYYEKTVQGSRKINVLVACGQTCKTVPKISSIYYFAPGAHTEGDGYLYQNRQLSDTFVFPNGKDGKVDSVFVDVDPAEEIAE